jgi:hypothetical protein
VTLTELEPVPDPLATPVTRPALPPVCWLYIRKRRFFDGSQIDEPISAPVALDDLSVTWGRQDSLMQPSPATAEFRILDSPGGRRFLDDLRIGYEVDIVASAIIFPDSHKSTLADGGFEVRADAHLVNATAAATTVRKIEGKRSLQVKHIDGAKQVLVSVPPAPFSSTITAWDALPRTIVGGTWKWSAKVRIPMPFLGWNLWSVWAEPVGWSKPNGAPTVVLGARDTSRVADPMGGNWFQFSGSFNATAGGYWPGVRIQFGRAGPHWNELHAGAWNSLGTVPAWQDAGLNYVDDVQMHAPEEGAARSGFVFTGRITDLDASWDDDAGGTVVNVIAQDVTAELANRFIGKNNWPTESLSARFARILAEAGRPVSAKIDAAIQKLTIAKREGGRQDSLSLLQELAVSAGAVLWTSTHALDGDWLQLSDINSRPALLALKLNEHGSMVVIGWSDKLLDNGVVLDACHVLLEPVHWQQATYDDSTRLSVDWVNQKVNPPEVETYEIIDKELEAQSGSRSVSISTVLTNETEAQKLGNETLARLSNPGWRVTSLTIDLSIEESLDSKFLSVVMQILDGYTRLDLPLLLTNLPGWVPVSAANEMPLFLEGSRLTNRDGTWVLELITSNARGQGESARWHDLPASTKWEWRDFDPDIDWIDLSGVEVVP